VCYTAYEHIGKRMEIIMEKLQQFFRRKDIEISGKRYGIDALGAMAQGLFASLLIGTIISTIGERAGIEFLVTIGGYAKAVTGEAMAVAIGYSLHCPPLVLFSLAAVGHAANTLGGAGGPLAVLLITILAAELGKAVSKETKIDIIVTPLVTTYSFYLGLDQLILPYEIGTYLIFFSMGYVTLRDFAKCSAIKMAVSVVFTLAIMIPWWLFVVKIM